MLLDLTCEALSNYYDYYYYYYYYYFTTTSSSSSSSSCSSSSNIIIINVIFITMILSGFPVKILYAFFSPPMRVTCLAHPISLNHQSYNYRLPILT
jgi:hypothetical protein